jgi:hypothetical protein
MGTKCAFFIDDLPRMLPTKIFDIIDKIIIIYSKKEEKDGCSFLWQGFHGNVDVVTFSIFKDKEVQQVALGDDHCLFLTKDGGNFPICRFQMEIINISNL